MIEVTFWELLLYSIGLFGFAWIWSANVERRRIQAEIRKIQPIDWSAVNGSKE
jgi:hypothetical protein